MQYFFGGLQVFFTQCLTFFLGTRGFAPPKHGYHHLSSRLAKTVLFVNQKQMFFFAVNGYAVLLSGENSSFESYVDIRVGRH